MLGLIWAQSRSGVIGRDGVMPWHLPEDLAHFKSVTLGHPVVMGRRTWDSIEPRFRPLVGRRNIVMTRDRDWAADGAEVASSIEAALDLAGHPDQETWVIGGGSVYAATLDRADRLEVTELDVQVDGDTVAPAVGREWAAIGDDDPHWSTSRTGLRYRFLTFGRA